MTTKLSSADLDRFLAEKGGASQVPFSKPPTPTENTTLHDVGNSAPAGTLQQTTGLVQQGNNTLQGVTELVKGLNDLVVNAGDLFLKGIANKEKRINGNSDVFPQGKPSYSDYAREKMQAKPKEITTDPIINLEASATTTADKIHTWFEATLDALPDDLTARQIKDQWHAGKRQFVGIILKIVKGDKTLNNESRTSADIAGKPLQLPQTADAKQEEQHTELENTTTTETAPLVVPKEETKGTSLKSRKVKQ